MRRGFVVILCVLLARTLGAEEKGDLQAVHIPNATVDAGEDLKIAVIVKSEQAVKGIRCDYRSPGEKEFKAIQLKPSDSGRWTGSVPSQEITPAGVEYHIVAELEGGRESPVFSSPENPFTVHYIEDEDTLHYRAKLMKYDGSLNKLSTSLYMQNFGKLGMEDAGGIEKLYPDYYTAMDISYSYLLLGELVHGIKFGFKYWAHKMPGKNAYFEHAAEINDEKEIERLIEPGFIAGYGGTEFEFADFIGLWTAVLIGASEKGFEVGFESFLRVGDAVGTRLIIGAEAVRRLGYKGYFEFVWDTVPYVPMAMRTEITTFPSNTRTASISYFKVMPQLTKNLHLELSVGYGVRKGFAEGGVSFGGGLQLVF
ncbi:MAG: hypothetical protein FJ088_13845 [Deltaproteobacteria bacterium]|nr:hypothetical protein [Deltaproteobacteria bacterium]